MNKNVIYAALMFVVTMSSGNASAQQFPYQNPALSAHESGRFMWSSHFGRKLL